MNKTKAPAKPARLKKNVNTKKITEKKTPTNSKEKSKPIKKIINDDVITKIISHNLNHILKQIFLTLSPGELSACRLVNTAWHGYFTGVFWVDKGVRSVLEDKLENNWRVEKHRRVEVKVEGAACRKNCALNYRPCDC